MSWRFSAVAAWIRFWSRMPRLSSENPAWKELEYASSVAAHKPAIANARLAGGAVSSGLSHATVKNQSKKEKGTDAFLRPPQKCVCPLFLSVSFPRLRDPG